MILDEVTCRFGLYNGSNGHGGGFSSGVLLGSSGFFWRSSGVLLAFFCVIEHQKNARRTPEGTPEEPRRTQKEKNTSMGDYGWSMNSDTSQGIVAVEHGRVLEYPKKRNKSQTTRKPDLFR